MRKPRFDRLLHPAKRLILVGFIMDVGAACMVLAVQLKGDLRLHASPFELGLMGGSLFVVYPFITAASGHLSDRLGRRSLALLASGLCAVAWGGMILAQSVWQLIPLGVLSGTGLALLWPPVEAWLADLSGDSARVLNRHLGLFNIAWTAGLMVGPLAAGQLWQSQGERIFLIAAGTALLTVITALTTPTPAPAEHHVASPEHLDERRVRSFLYASWIALGAAIFGRGMVAACFPKLGTELDFSPVLIGRLLFALAAGQGVMFLAMRMTTVWQYRRWPLFAPSLVGLVAMLIAGFTNRTEIFAGAFALMGATVGTTFMCGLTYAMQGTPEQRGKRAGQHEAIMGAGLFLGPMLGGTAGQYHGLHAQFFLGAAVFVVAAVAQVVLWRRHTVQQP